MGAALALFGSKKKAAQAAAAPTDGTTSGPIVKQLDANDPLRRKKGGAALAPDFRSGIATILSDKLGN